LSKIAKLNTREFFELHITMILTGKFAKLKCSKFSQGNREIKMRQKNSVLQ